MRYAWTKGRKGLDIGRRWYIDKHQSKNDVQGMNKSRAVGVDGIRGATGPYYYNDPRYLDT